MRYLSLMLVAAILVGCSGTLSTIGDGPDRASGSVYPLTEEQANKVLGTAMSAEFAGGPISRVEFPNQGYQATIEFLLDSHNIVAYMIKAKGRAADGSVVDGYVFQVSHSGTMPVSGSARAKKLFEQITQNASMIAPAVPLASY